MKKVEETVKQPINEELDLRNVLKSKRIVWNESVAGQNVKVAEFDLPLEDIRPAVDLDAIFGQGWDK